MRPPNYYCAKWFGLTTRWGVKSRTVRATRVGSRKSEVGVSREHRSGEASVCAGQTQASFEYEVEEERVEAVNLAQRVALRFVEVARASERARAYERVDGGQRIVTPVDESRVEVFARDDGRERLAYAVNLRHRGDVSEDEPVVAA